MKKALILEGPQGSGKTWISIGISHFFPDEYLFISRRSIDLRKANNFGSYKLIIIDECISALDILSIEKIRENLPEVNFIFLTQKPIYKLRKHFDNTKYHRVMCSYDIFLKWA